MDFVLAILPWHVVISLKMKRKEKITIIFGLSLGMLAGVCSIIRTVELESLASMEDYVYKTAPMLLWSSGEICLTVICACIPVLRPLYTRLRYGHNDDSTKHSYPLSNYSNLKNPTSGSDGAYAGNDPYIGASGPKFQTTVNSGGKQSTDGVMREYIEQHGTPDAKVDVEKGPRASKDIVVTTTVTSKGEGVWH